MVDIPFDEVQKLAGDGPTDLQRGLSGHARLRAAVDRRSRGRGACGRRGAALRGAAGLHRVRRLRPGRSRPDPAAGCPDPGRLRSAAQHRRDPEQRLGVDDGRVDRRPGRGARSLDDGPGGRRRDRRCALRQRQSVGQAGRDLPAQVGRHPGAHQLPRRQRAGALRRGHLHRLPLLRRQRDAGGVPLRLWTQLHLLRVQQSQALCRHVRRCGRRDRLGGRDEHRAGRGQGDRPGLRARPQVRAGASPEGTQGLRQGRASAGRDEDGHDRSSVSAPSRSIIPATSSGSPRTASSTS